MFRCSAIARFPSGPHSTASTTPEWIPIVGTPSPAAMCFGPVLLPTYNAQAAKCLGRSLSATLPMSDSTSARCPTSASTSSASCCSSGPPIKTTLTLLRLTRRSISSAKCRGGHCRIGLPTPGCTATTGFLKSRRARRGRKCRFFDRWSSGSVSWMRCFSNAVPTASTRLISASLTCARLRTSEVSASHSRAISRKEQWPTWS